MISPAKLLRLMWSLATLAAIIGILLGVMAPVSSLYMAVPVFTGQRIRDATMVAFMGLPVVQVASVVVGTIREESSPRTAIRLYVLALALLFLLVALPALADLAL